MLPSYKDINTTGNILNIIFYYLFSYFCQFGTCNLIVKTTKFVCIIYLPIRVIIAFW